MELDQYGKTLAVDIAFWRQGFIDPAYPIEQMGKMSIELSGKYRAIAILALLVGGSSDLYFHHLIRSARIRIIYLERLKKEKVYDDHHQSSGRYDAFLDVVAAGDFNLAKRIVGLSPNDWRKGHEYEDDYCYAQILHRFVLESPSIEEIQSLLTQFETYLEGEPNARFDVCKALMEKDQEAFDVAFEALLADQENRIEENKERGQLEDPIVIANRLVFVEGLAILRLAENKGLQTQREYRFCPSLARIPMVKPFPGE